MLDTGLDHKHSEFSGRIVNGYDFVSDDNDPDDEGPYNGRGTLSLGQ